jgi:hypothetical protein
MNENNLNKNKQQEPFDLEKRLSAYYGPPLQEQPLSPSSWQNLRLRLPSQENVGRRYHIRWPFPRKRSRTDVPTSIQDAFARIVYEARIPYAQLMLRYQLTLRTHEPIVRGSWLGRRTIQLLLPVNLAAMIGQAELDVLLATGVARSIYARKPAYMLGRLLLVGGMLFAGIMLTLFWMYHLPPVVIPIVIVLFTIFMWLLHMQARSIAFHADTLIVHWLGREHVCNGLHALANRSRSPRRRRWGEPSLVERIGRICGTRVEARENELTLIR